MIFNIALEHVVRKIPINSAVGKKDVVDPGSDGIGIDGQRCKSGCLEFFTKAGLGQVPIVAPLIMMLLGILL